MKNVLKLILSLVILFGTVPVYGIAQTKTIQTCEVKEPYQIVLSDSEDVKKKKKKKGKKISEKGKKKKKGFFSKIFGSK